MPGIAWKRWNWLRNGLIPLLSAAMRAAWLAPLLQLLLTSRYVHPAGARFPAWLILALLLGGSAWERLWRNRPRATLAIVLGGPGRGSFAVTNRPAWAIDWRHPSVVVGIRLDAHRQILSGLPAGLVALCPTTALWRSGLLIALEQLWRITALFLCRRGHAGPAAALPRGGGRRAPCEPAGAPGRLCRLQPPGPGPGLFQPCHCPGPNHR